MAAKSAAEEIHLAYIDTTATRDATVLCSMYAFSRVSPFAKAVRVNSSLAEYRMDKQDQHCCGRNHLNQPVLFEIFCALTVNPSVDSSLSS